MKFTLTISQDTVKRAYQETVAEMAQNVTLKGFRKGKAPLDIVEKSLDKNHVYEHMMSHILPPAYGKYIQENNLQPITDPKISIKSAGEDKDWEFDVEIAEKPEVKLGKYKDAIKSAKAKDVIWTPDKAGADTKEETEEQKRDKQLTAIFDALLETCTVDVPELLVDQEVNRALSQLVNQVSKLGLTIDQYLESMGKKSEELREEYAKTATENLKLEFILDAIAGEEKLVASDEEVQTFIRDVPADLKKKVEDDPYQKAAIRLTLTKRKVVDFLMTL